MPSLPRIARVPAKYASVTAEEFANISRAALRAYDACQAGDEFNARTFFDNLPMP
jgi:hypothetical protein